MKTQYLIMVISVFSFSVLMAQQKEGKLASKFEKETATKVEQQIADIKTSANSPSSTAAVPVSYDFTTGSDKYFNGAAGAKDLGSDVWGMVAGDANQDGQVTSLDYDLWLPEGKSATTGYSSTDMNLDGQNTSLDYDLWLPNAKSAKTSQVPN